MIKSLLTLGIGVFAAAAPFVVASSAEAQGQAATLQTDCAAEIATHCANVTPGDDRIVACLIAHEEKISTRCRLTAYLGSGNLGVRLKELQSMAKTCSSDIVQYCSDVRPGGGRIYDCIKKNRATLTNECRNSLESIAPL